MPTVAVVIGHHPDAPGAALRLGEHTLHEYSFWRPFGRELVRSLQTVDIGAHLVERPNPDPDQELADRINATGADAAIELHFNSYKNVDVEGTEMLHYTGSEGGEQLAVALLDKTTGAIGTVSRGLRPKQGWPFLTLTEMPAVICEPAYGSNTGDAWKLMRKQMELLGAYRSALEAYFAGTV